MCDMLGISTSKPSVPNERLIRLLFQRGKYNPDGWGIAWYQGKRVTVIKSPQQATITTAERFLKRHGHVQSPIFVIHLRGASVGRVTCNNTHPFHRRLFGKEYVFAHNGHLDNSHHLPVGQFIPRGQTDSERLFCHILFLIKQQKIQRWTPTTMSWLEKTLRHLNKDDQKNKKKYGKLNCIFSDGDYLFFYHDLNGFNNYWAFHKQQQKEMPAMFLISMCKLTRAPWTRAKKGKLVVIRKGKMI